MKLKAPQGVGDPCVAGVAIKARDGVYDVGDDIGALLIECFGFIGVVSQDNANLALRRALPPARRARPALRSPRRVKPAS